MIEQLYAPHTCYMYPTCSTSKSTLYKDTDSLKDIYFLLRPLKSSNLAYKKLSSFFSIITLENRSHSHYKIFLYNKLYFNWKNEPKSDLTCTAGRDQGKQPTCPAETTCLTRPVVDHGTSQTAMGEFYQQKPTSSRLANLGCFLAATALKGRRLLTREK